MKNETTAPSPIDRMIDFLTTHYAFRYNTVMNCTEYRHVDSPVSSSEPLICARADASFLRCSAKASR